MRVRFSDAKGKHQQLIQIQLEKNEYQVAPDRREAPELVEQPPGRAPRSARGRGGRRGTRPNSERYKLVTIVSTCLSNLSVNNYLQTNQLWHRLVLNYLLCRVISFTARIGQHYSDLLINTILKHEKDRDL